eukprot:1162092-Pelagomonas_calceolata.AAC.5
MDHTAWDPCLTAQDWITLPGILVSRLRPGYIMLGTQLYGLAFFLVWLLWTAFVPCLTAQDWIISPGIIYDSSAPSNPNGSHRKWALTIKKMPQVCSDAASRLLMLMGNGKVGTPCVSMSRCRADSFHEMENASALILIGQKEERYKAEQGKVPNRDRTLLWQVTCTSQHSRTLQDSTLKAILHSPRTDMFLTGKLQAEVDARTGKVSLGSIHPNFTVKVAFTHPGYQKRKGKFTPAERPHAEAALMRPRYQIEQALAGSGSSCFFVLVFRLYAAGQRSRECAAEAAQIQRNQQAGPAGVFRGAGSSLSVPVCNCNLHEKLQMVSCLLAIYHIDSSKTGIIDP